MSNQAEFLNKIKENYPVLTREFGVKRIGIFGSVAQNKEGPESDIDIVVEFDRPIGLRFVNFVEYIENLFGRKVDVLTQDGIENIRLKDISTDIKRHIIYV
ncbi:MAG: nucleotidyltransferase family protein [Thermodesulfobacteria bacterium]|nr:nucleotidyltransferase family protein [Thermodesulfobacteriota bacterium]